MGDLVEYLFAKKGQWAQLRREDGHAAPYNAETTWFELGNEIDNTNFVKQALNMEQRAESVGVGGVLRYACPWQCGTKILREGARQLGPRAYLDLHTQDQPALALLNNTIAHMGNGSLRFSIWETNTGKNSKEKHAEKMVYSCL